MWMTLKLQALPSSFFDKKSIIFNYFRLLGLTPALAMLTASLI